MLPVMWENIINKYNVEGSWENYSVIIRDYWYVEGKIDPLEDSFIQ